MILKHLYIYEEKEPLQQMRKEDGLKDFLTLSGLFSIKQQGAKISMYED